MSCLGSTVGSQKLFVCALSVAFGSEQCSAWFQVASFGLLQRVVSLLFPTVIHLFITFLFLLTHSRHNRWSWSPGMGKFRLVTGRENASSWEHRGPGLACEGPQENPACDSLQREAGLGPHPTDAREASTEGANAGPHLALSGSAAVPAQHANMETRAEAAAPPFLFLNLRNPHSFPEAPLSGSLPCISWNMASMGLPQCCRNILFFFFFQGIHALDLQRNLCSGHWYSN